MIENNWTGLLANKKRNLFEVFLYAMLHVFSAFYALGLVVKRALFRIGVIKQATFKTKIISVGNLTVGGTGKTPFVEAMCRRLLKKDKDVLVVAKGYKRKKLNNIDVVSNGEKVLLKAKYAGDEPYMIARNVPKIKVVVGSDKIKAIRYGVEKFKPEVVLLDDGFQKRYNLKASSNVVLINALNPFGYGYLFPAGLLRERVSALSEADVAVITNVNLMSDPARLDRIKNIILKYNKSIKIFEAVHEPKQVYNISTNEKHETSFLKNKRVIAFSSIGSPAGFEKTLKNLEAHIIFGFYYGDHHYFVKKELEGIARLYEKTNASFVITTEKDEVRIKRKFLGTTPVYALRIGMVIPQFKELDEALKV